MGYEVKCTRFPAIGWNSVHCLTRFGVACRVTGHREAPSHAWDGVIGMTAPWGMDPQSWFLL